MRVNLKLWLNKGELQKVEVTQKTLNDLLGIVERDLGDAQIEALSVDRRFATAYGAALNLASYVIRVQGYRVSAKKGHHKITFDIAAEVLGKESSRLLDFFDICRRKRNKVDYDFTDVVSEGETKELIEVVKSFKKLIFSHNFEDIAHKSVAHAKGKPV